MNFQPIGEIADEFELKSEGKSEFIGNIIEAARYDYIVKSLEIMLAIDSEITA